MNEKFCKCDKPRPITINAKCSDLCETISEVRSHVGYVPSDIGLEDGWGDYVRFTYCLGCGQIRGRWPAPEAEIELEEERDPDACPGCGCMPGEVTEGCDHPDGCGYSQEF